MKFKKTKLSMMIALGGTIGSAFVPLSTTQAQEATSQEIPEEIVVTGVRGSLQRSLDSKRDAVGVVDGIVAEDIADFPDLNIGEALQRISGVTLDRSDNGEGSRISVRGLPSDFVRTTLNGITAASAGSDGANAVRAFDFDIFASELFSKVELYKSGSADLTEGGIAATVNLQTPRPFDYGGPRLVTSVRGQHSELSGSGGSIDPRLALLASNTWGNFGAAVSVAYSDTQTRGDLSQGFRYQTTGAAFLNGALAGIDDGSININDINVNGNPASRAQLEDIAANTLTDALPRVGPLLFDRERLGITTAFQYLPTDDLTLSADILYATFDDVGFRSTIDGLVGFGRRGVTPTNIGVSNGFVNTATLQNLPQRSEALEDRFEADFTHITLEADWTINEQWTGSGLFGYSSAEEDELRRTYLYQNVSEFNFDISDPRFPQFNSPNFDLLNPDDYVSGGFRFRPRTREDEETSLQFDLARSFDNGSALKSIAFGVRVSDKEVSQVRGERRGRLDAFGQDNNTPLREVGTNIQSLAPGFLSGAPAGTPRDFLLVSPEGGNRLLPRSLTATVPNDPLSTWQVAEDTQAAYVKSIWEPSWGIVDVGVRVVKTEQTSSGSQVIGGVAEPISIDNDYTEVLPSINVKVDLSDELILRFAANKAITRPTLGQLSPGTAVFPTNLEARAGNPGLDPFTATQFDASLEWYFADEGLLSATLFYKDIDSFIVNSFTNQVITGTNLVDDDGNNVSGALFEVSRPDNGEGGKLSGLELNYQQPFGETGFGTVINATFSDSEGTFISAGETIRADLQGNSDLTYNLIGYYENDKFSFRMAYSFRSDFRTNFREGFEERTDDRKQLDLSASYNIGDNLTLTFDALNVTGENQERIFGPQQRNNGLSIQEPVYVFGARYNFL